MSVNMSSSEMQALLSQGLKLYQEGRNQAALEVYDRILAHSSNHVDALNMAGATAWRDGDVSRALAYLDKAMLAHPSHPQAYLNLGVILEQHGRLEEAANAYRAALQADPDQILAHLNLGNALATQGQNTLALEAFDAVLAREPENLDALNNKALVLKTMGQTEAAEMLLREAVRIAPSSEQSWTNLGLVLRLGAKVDEAFVAYEQVLRLNPASVKALNNLAVLHRWQGNLEEAEDLCRGVLKHHPDTVEVLNNLGDILQAQGRVDEARAAFERVLTIDPAHPEGHHNLAVLMLLCGEFKTGWQHYEWRWLAKEFPSERRNFPQPLWMGEALDGKTILLYVEQGLGDALQFVRYAPLVHARGGRVIVECPKSLKRLFETVAGIERVIARGEDLPPFEVQCPFLSLPGLLSPEADLIPAEVPYLGVADDEAAAWRTRLHDSTGLKVGLVWAGSPHHTNDRERSIALQTLSPLSDVKGCTFVNLQIGPSAEQLQQASWPIIDLTYDIKDYADTAALVSQLDLVITVDTSVAHVAGALAKPVWVLLPHAPDWRWQIERTDSPWYPTMTLYRQPKRRDWISVLERVERDLRQWAERT
ncbi:tetratricopeptide repeat protein [Magnetovibrio sp.]|uniref:tetratricopeptide repeat protein n=1 Tax=Magnetovibrio sp. TaxID=2024836 RepID=UPI002F92CDBA